MEVDAGLLERVLKDADGTWRSQLARAASAGPGYSGHGDAGTWQAAVDALTQGTEYFESRGATVICGGADKTRDGVEALRALRPWRKGPFLVDGVHVDAEWRSDLKWLRLCRHTGALAGHTVLDLGSGNGYYLLRALGAGAAAALGLEPNPLAGFQFAALARRSGRISAAMLPLRFEHLPEGSELFDTILHMGVMHHTRSPLGHLARLRRIIRSGGQLVIETLVVDGGPDRVLVPPGRYARMRNVWMLPSCLAIERWLARSGFRSFGLVSVARTGPQEQRTTDWMPFESLDKAIAPDNASLTVEGLPAPLRAMWLVEAR